MMQPLLTIPTILAHGGTAGALVEGGLIFGVLFIFAAVWIRERRAGERRGDLEDEGAEPRAEQGPLRDDID